MPQGAPRLKGLGSAEVRMTAAGSRWLASTSELRWRISSAEILLARSESASRSCGNLAMAVATNNGDGVVRREVVLVVD